MFRVPVHTNRKKRQKEHNLMHGGTEACALANKSSTKMHLFLDNETSCSPSYDLCLPGNAPLFLFPNFVKKPNEGVSRGNYHDLPLSRCSGSVAIDITLATAKTRHRKHELPNFT